MLEVPHDLRNMLRGGKRIAGRGSAFAGFRKPEANKVGRQWPLPPQTSSYHLNLLEMPSIDPFILDVEMVLVGLGLPVNEWADFDFGETPV